MRTHAAVAGLLLGWSLSACSGGGNSGGGGQPVDTTQPVLTGSNLGDASTGVATDLAINLQFSEPMDTASVEAAFGVTGPSGPLSGTLAWDAERRVATFTPAAPYPPSRRRGSSGVSAPAAPRPGSTWPSAWDARRR